MIGLEVERLREDMCRCDETRRVAASVLIRVLVHTGLKIHDFFCMQVYYTINGMRLNINKRKGK